MVLRESDQNHGNEAISSVTEEGKYIYLKGWLLAVKFFLSKINLSTKYSKMPFTLAHEEL